MDFSEIFSISSCWDNLKMILILDPKLPWEWTPQG